MSWLWNSGIILKSTLADRLAGNMIAITARAAQQRSEGLLLMALPSHGLWAIFCELSKLFYNVAPWLLSN